MNSGNTGNVIPPPTAGDPHKLQHWGWKADGKTNPTAFPGQTTVKSKT